MATYILRGTRWAAVAAGLVIAATACVPNQDKWPASAPEPNGTTCWHSSQNYLEIDCNTVPAAQYASVAYQPWPSIEVIYTPGASA